MDFLLEALTNWLKEMLVGGIMSNLSGMFDSVNQQAIPTVPADGYADLCEQTCAGGDGRQRIFVRHRLRQDRGARYR